MSVLQQGTPPHELASLSTDKIENIEDSLQTVTLQFYPAKIRNLLLLVYSVGHLPNPRA